MKGTTFGASLLALASSALATPAVAPRDNSGNSANNPVTVKGNAFYQADGSRFYIRGVDYQPGGASNPVDPIANLNDCKRDIPYFKKLGLNTVRIYTVDNSANHDECMNELAENGIYLALDVNSGKYSLNRADPGPSYNNVYLQSVFATIDEFARYNNTLLFFSGNEVINTPQTSSAAPYVKAVTRDMRQYIRERGYRLIPVGYSAADVEANRFQMAEYMNCGTEDERSDFYSFNDYSWCDPSSYTQSGWSQKVQQYSNYGIPLFLSEYGCNHHTPRDFEEVAALYSDMMTPVYSGGLVYEWSEESDNPNFGLVNINGNSVSPRQDYKNLMQQFDKTKSPSGDGGAKDSQNVSPCPPRSLPNWDVPGDALPAIPAPAKKYFTQGAGKGPGLNGPGSQDAGTQSTGTATPGSGAVSGVATGASSTGTGIAGTLRPAAFAVGPIVSALIVVVASAAGATLL